MQGAPGYVDEVVVDTMHFRGNFPQAVEVYAVEERAAHEVAANDERWELVVPRSPCQKDTEHRFEGSLLKGQGKVVTHVKLVMIPDGGIKRLRVFGRRAV